MPELTRLRDADVPENACFPQDVTKPQQRGRIEVHCPRAPDAQKGAHPFRATETPHEAVTLWTAWTREAGPHRLERTDPRSVGSHPRHRCRLPGLRRIVTGDRDRPELPPACARRPADRPLYRQRPEL